MSGNFAQLKALKAQHPDLKTFISLGGWTWSKNFSAAASTVALRKQLVSSCIDIYIRGNLPVQDYHGGAGAAAGVFDGIDIDWEFPGGGGMPYNGQQAADKENYTLLLAEMRRQLDAQGAIDNKHYGLTAAIGAGKDKIDFTEPAQYAQYLDWINVMSVTRLSGTSSPLACRPTNCCSGFRFMGGAGPALRLGRMATAYTRRQPVLHLGAMKPASTTSKS